MLQTKLPLTKLPLTLRRGVAGSFIGFVCIGWLAAIASAHPPQQPTDSADDRANWSPPNTEPASSGEPMPASLAAERMTLPDGFSATAFASEPDVQNPIAMSWDNRGRLWVAENYTYAERAQRFDLSLRDRVVIFDGTDSDHFTTRTIFTDDVQMLTGIAVVDDGVYLMCPPRLLFIPDRDHDDVPDGPAETVLDGFEVAQANYHNFANGIRMADDGWLYGRCGGSCPGRIGRPGTEPQHRLAMEGGIWRYHRQRRVVEVLTTGTCNPWGHDFDADGQMFFVNTVNGHLWHMIPGAHFTRPFTLDPNRLTYDLIDFHADHWHFDTTGAWHESRDGAANSLGGGHAHSGTLIYKHHAWPQKYHGKLWTLNFHGRRINQERLERRGTGYVAKHEDDFAVMADPWFRGMDLSTGPDGNVFVLDWSDAGECHEHDGVHRTSGRIYKIRYDGPANPEPTATDDRDATDGINSNDEHQVARAIRNMTDDWPIDDAMGESWKDEATRQRVAAKCDQSLPTMLQTARQHPSGLVRLTLASTLQRLPIERRGDLAAVLVSRDEDIGDHNQPLMIWYGILPLLQRPDDLMRVAEACRLPTTLRLIARGVSESIQERPEMLDRLLQQKRDEGSLDRAVLDGMVLGLRGMQRAPMPPSWPAFRNRFDSDDSAVRGLDVLFGDGRAVDDLVAIVSGETASDDAARSMALQTLIDADVEGIRDLCVGLLKNPKLNVIAASGLSKLDDPAIGKLLVERYRNFRAPKRPRLISILVSRKSFAAPLIQAIEAGRLPRTALTAFDVRQIHSLGDEALSQRIAAAWGEVRETPEEAQRQIEDLKQRLTPERLASADMPAGRTHFKKLCQTCHQLYGEGAKVGPDLTGAGRSNLDYLLTNIIAPSAVVDKDYRLSILMTVDGRVINGLVMDESPHAMRVQTATEMVTVPTEDIERRKITDQSPMPSGLISNLDDQSIAELISYLQHPTQVPLPVESP